MEYKLALAGGTFDRLHLGHRTFLQYIFTVAQKAIIGVTTDAFVNNEKKVHAQPFEIRKKNVENFLESQDLEGRFELIPIDDIYGVALDKNLLADVMIVTTDTQKNGELINEKRKELDLPVLSLVMVTLAKDKNGNIFSSTTERIIEESLLQNGCIPPEWLHYNLVLPDHLREALHKPFGTILQQIPETINPLTTITVGDVTTKLFNNEQLSQKISIVDFVVERDKKYKSLVQLGFDDKAEVYKMKNPPGHITRDIWSVLLQANATNTNKRSVIQIIGEEDLLVLPCILIAPNGWHIYYGQPGIGLVDIVVSEHIKHQSSEILSQFSLQH